MEHQGPENIKQILLRRSSLIILLILILGAFGLIRLIYTHKDVVDVTNIDLPLIELLTRIETNQLEQSINFERAVRYAENLEVSELSRSEFAIADSTFRYLAALVDVDLLDADDQVTNALYQTTQESQRIKLKGLLLSLKKLESEHTSYEKHALEVMELLESGAKKQAMELIEQVEKEEDQFNKQVEGVLMRHEIFTESLMQIVEQEEVISMKWILTLTVLFIMVALVAVYFFSYQIWKPLEDIRDGAERLGSGDLSARVKLKPNRLTAEIVEAFNGMADRIEDSQKEINRFIHFSYSTAHDLKAPILNIQSLLTMLEKEKPGSSNYATILRNSKRSVSQLENTIQALSEVNKVREALGAAKEVIQFDEILKEVITENLTQIKESKTAIRKDFSECREVEYSRSQLKSIFSNLITNAIKYRDPDKPSVIRMKTRMMHGHVSVMIKDNGLGFDSIKYQDDVFKPFTRLHSHTEGSGLGLYLVKTILEYNNGDIRIESEPKKGALFAIRLN
jgi:signal transduction histidine kinase